MAYRSSSSVASVTPPSVEELVCPLPSGAQPTDLLLAVVEAFHSDAIDGYLGRGPTGWTPVAHLPNAGDGRYFLTVFSAPGTVTDFTLPLLSTIGACYADIQIHAFSGRNLNNPISAIGLDANNIGDFADSAAPDILAKDGDDVIALWSTRYSSQSPGTPLNAAYTDINPTVQTVANPSPAFASYRNNVTVGQTGRIGRTPAWYYGGATKITLALAKASTTGPDTTKKSPVIPVRNVRTTQPQTPVGIDWSNPITRGLLFEVTTASMWVGKSVVGTKPVTYKGSRLIGFNATLGAGSTDVVSMNLPPHPQRTFVVQAFHRTNNGGHLYNRRAGLYDEESLYLNGDQLAFTRRFDGTNSNCRWDLQLFSSAKLRTFVLRYDESSVSNVPELWMEGVKIAPTASTNPTGAATTPDADVYVGNSSSGNSCWDGGISLVSVLSRMVTDAEAVSLSRNPWQLFMPVQERVFVPSVVEVIASKVHLISANSGADSSGVYDTYLNADAANTAQGSSAVMVSNASAQYRVVVGFDIPSGLSGASVSGAALSLFNNYGDAGSLTVYKLLRTPVEATATFNKYDGTNNWGTACALNTTTDYDTTVLASGTFSSGVGRYYDLTDSRLAAAVEASVGGTLWLVVDSVAFQQFATKEGADGTRPKLKLTYAPPAFTRTAEVGYSNNSYSASIVLPSFASVAGNTIVGYIAHEDSDPETINVSDSAGNTYVLGTPTKHSALANWITYFYCLSSLGNASNVITITLGVSVSYRNAHAAEYSVQGRAVFVGTNYTEGIGTTLTSANLALAASDGLLYAGTKSYNGTTITAVGSGSLIATQGGYGGASEQFLYAAGSYSAAFNYTGTPSVNMQAVLFASVRELPSISPRQPTTPRQSQMMGTAGVGVASTTPIAESMVRRVRTSQPQTPVGVDWGNPITRGLVFAWEASFDKDAVSGASHNKGSIVTKSRGRNGTQLGISDTSGASNFGSSPAFSNGATETTAMLDIYFASGSPSEKPFGQWDGNNHWLIQLSAGNLIWVAAQGSGAARRRWDATGFITAPGWYRIILVWRGGASAAAFVNGVDVSASLSVVNNTATVIDSTSQILSVGQTAPMTDIIGGFISGAKFWRRGLSDAEVRSISANPWQLFAPDNKKIWVPT